MPLWMGAVGGAIVGALVYGASYILSHYAQRSLSPYYYYPVLRDPKGSLLIIMISSMAVGTIVAAFMS